MWITFWMAVLEDIAAALIIASIGYLFAFKVPGYTPLNKLRYLCSRISFFLYRHEDHLDTGVNHSINLCTEAMYPYLDTNVTDLKLQLDSPNTSEFILNENQDSKSNRRITPVEAKVALCEAIRQTYLPCHMEPRIDELLKSRGVDAATSVALNEKLARHHFYETLADKVEARLKRTKWEGILHNGPVYSLKAIDATDSRRITIARSSFYHYMLTNYLADDDSWDTFWLGQTKEPEHNDRENLNKQLLEVIGANNIAFHLNIILEYKNKYWVLLTKRSKINLNQGGVWGHTTGGELSFGNHRAFSPTPRAKQLADGIAARAERETGVKVEAGEILVNALVTNNTQFQPILVTSYVTDTRKLATFGLNRELTQFRPLRFTPEQVAYFLHHLHQDKWHTDTFADLFFGLLSVYPFQRVRTAFESEYYSRSDKDKLNPFLEGVAKAINNGGGLTKPTH
jgi:hypothetical protein